MAKPGRKQSSTTEGKMSKKKLLNGELGSNGEPVQHEVTTRADSTNYATRGAITLVVPRWLYCYMPIAVGVLAVVSSSFVSRYHQHVLEDQLLKKTDTLGLEAVDVFVDLDKDGDFHLSLEEAEPLLLHFVDQAQGKPTVFSSDVIPGEDVVSVVARFTPLNTSTMTKDFENDFQNNESFHGLFHWLSPHTPVKDFGVSRFRDLLPDDLENIPVPGTVYSLVEAPHGLLGSPHLPSNRYYPPRAVGREISVQHLLAMFHPQAFVTMRFPPQGVLACVRAISQSHIAVAFRMHSEFQLNEPPLLPFWFTPSQFAGSLVMSRDGSRVEHLHLFVPTDRRLNVDMEWLNDKDDPESMEVDIGYMPLMELSSAGPSRPKAYMEEAQQVEEFSWDDIAWEQEISEQEARDALELKLFPFKQVKYHNLSEAFTVAQAESKLVHCIVLWGALDDQSC